MKELKPELSWTTKVGVAVSAAYLMFATAYVVAFFVRNSDKSIRGKWVLFFAAVVNLCIDMLIVMPLSLLLRHVLLPFCVARLLKAPLSHRESILRTNRSAAAALKLEREKTRERRIGSTAKRAKPATSEASAGIGIAVLPAVMRARNRFKSLLNNRRSQQQEEIYVDPASGYRYRFNFHTGETEWVDGDAGNRGTELTARTNPISDRSGEADNRQSPPGEIYVDPVSGYRYRFDFETGEAEWVDEPVLDEAALYGDADGRGSELVVRTNPILDRFGDAGH